MYLYMTDWLYFSNIQYAGALGFGIACVREAIEYNMYLLPQSLTSGIARLTLGRAEAWETVEVWSYTGRVARVPSYSMQVELGARAACLCSYMEEER